MFSAGVSWSGNSRKWRRGLQTHETYLRHLADVAEEEFLNIVINLFDSSVYERVYVRKSPSYDEAIEILSKKSTY